MAKRLLACALFAFALGAGSPIFSGSAVAQSPDTLKYRIRTLSWNGSSCATERVHEAVVGVPTPIDVQGLPEPDLLVHVTGVPGVPSVNPPNLGPASIKVSVTKLTLSPVRASIELIHNTSAQDRVSFGLDGCEQHLPGAFDADATVSSTGLFVTMRPSEPPAVLTVFGGKFRELAPSTRSTPTTVRARFSPVPATMTASYVKTGSEHVVGLNTSQPTRVEATFQDVQPAKRTDVSGTIDRVPGSVHLRAREGYFRYNASGSVGLIEAKIVEIPASGPRRETLARLTGVQATEATVEQTGATKVRFSANAPIGQFTAGMATGGPVRLMHEASATPDYLHVYGESGYNSVAARLRQLTFAEIDTADPLVVDVQHGGGPFQIFVKKYRLVNGVNTLPLTIDAWVRDLPPQFRIAYSPSAQTVVYSGSHPITEITADVNDPLKLFGTVTDVDVILRNVPTALDIKLAQQSGTVVLDAKGKTIGLLDVRLASPGATDRLPTGQDGLLVRDHGSSKYVVHARVSSLKRVASSEFRNHVGTITLPFIGTISIYESGRDVNLQTAAGRPFAADLQMQNAATQGRLESTKATVSNLAATMNLTTRTRSWRLQSGYEFSEHSRIWYTASSKTNGLTFQSNAGRMNGGAAGVTASLAPLPASLYLCSNASFAGSYCSGTGHAANQGSMHFSASEHLTLNLTDCQDAGCNDKQVVQNLSIRKLRMESHEGDPNADFIDTDWHTLSGRVDKYVGGSLEEVTVLPAGFRAEDRYVRHKGLWWSTSGSIHCPSGTEIWRKILGIWVNVSFVIC